MPSPSPRDGLSACRCAAAPSHGRNGCVRPAKDSRWEHAKAARPVTSRPLRTPWPACTRAGLIAGPTSRREESRRPPGEAPGARAGVVRAGLVGVLVDGQTSRSPAAPRRPPGLPVPALPQRTQRGGRRRQRGRARRLGVEREPGTPTGRRPSPTRLSSCSYSAQASPDGDRQRRSTRPGDQRLGDALLRRSTRPARSAAGHGGLRSARARRLGDLGVIPPAVFRSAHAAPPPSCRAPGRRSAAASDTNVSRAEGGSGVPSTGRGRPHPIPWGQRATSAGPVRRSRRIYAHRRRRCRHTGALLAPRASWSRNSG